MEEEEEEDFSSDDTSRSMILATRRSNKRQLILNGHPVRWHASRKCTITVTSFGRRVCRTRRPTRHEYTAEFFHRRERKTKFRLLAEYHGSLLPSPLDYWIIIFARFQPILATRTAFRSRLCLSVLPLPMSHFSPPPLPLPRIPMTQLEQRSVSVTRRGKIQVSESKRRGEEDEF